MILTTLSALAGMCNKGDGIHYFFYIEGSGIIFLAVVFSILELLNLHL
jgi:hypothetical protein